VFSIQDDCSTPFDPTPDHPPLPELHWVEQRFPTGKRLGAKLQKEEDACS
jgi:hypothetical protein